MLEAQAIKRKVDAAERRLDEAKRKFLADPRNMPPPERACVRLRRLRQHLADLHEIRRVIAALDG